MKESLHCGVARSLRVIPQCGTSKKNGCENERGAENMSTEKIGVLEPHYYNEVEFRTEFKIELAGDGLFHCVKCAHEWHAGRLSDNGEDFVLPSGLACPACNAQRASRIAEIERFVRALSAAGYSRPNYARMMNEQDIQELCFVMAKCLDLLDGDEPTIDEPTIDELHILGEAYAYGGRVDRWRMCGALDYPTSTLSRLQNQGKFPNGDYWSGLTVQEGLVIVRYIRQQQAMKKAKEHRKNQKSVLASAIEQ